SRVQRAIAAATVPLTMDDPVGADVYFNDYTDAGGPWVPVGRVPIKDVRVPQGELRWRLVKDGFDPVEGASPQSPVITIRRRGESPPGMLYVRGGEFRQGTVTAQLPDFWIDKYEVTNREFKRFVDAGGYRDPKYWKESFDGVAGLRDRTGQPGPATWELGTFPKDRLIIRLAGSAGTRPPPTRSLPASSCRPSSTGGGRSVPCCTARRSRRSRTLTASRRNQ